MLPVGFFYFYFGSTSKLGALTGVCGIVSTRPRETTLTLRSFYIYIYIERGNEHTRRGVLFQSSFSLSREPSSSTSEYFFFSFSLQKLHDIGFVS